MKELFNENKQILKLYFSDFDFGTMGVKRQQTWPDLTCNVVLVGDAKVGKTSLVHRAVADKFSEVRQSFVSAKITIIRVKVL
jgi:GTPase SAR1 family protein